MPTESASVGPFAHLHLHTEYSLLDGGNTIDRLLDRVKELGMNAVAVTDHGNLFGAVEFYTKAVAAGIKPILGIEAYVAPGDRRDRAPTGIADGGFHLVLLAENLTGWRNLLRLSSDSYLNGFYYRPRMDRSTLERSADGLIAINGHLGSSIAHHLLQHVQTGNDAHYASAVEEARWHARTFGRNESGEPRFFVELQRTGVEEQDRITPHLVRLARELELPIVCDNDAHFLTPHDHDVHDSLCCISMGKLKSDDNRLHYPRELYVKSPAEMTSLFADLPEAVENAARIAARCHVNLEFGEGHAPVVRVVSDGAAGSDEARVDDHPVGSTEWFKAICATYRLEPFDTTRDADLAMSDLQADCDRALRALCEAGLLWRYGRDGATGEIRARLERELTVLAEKRISAYFLIVWDFVNWARQKGIPAGARGSGVGTMVGYVLGLSNACPVRYGLLFERFTDPDRSEYPDIDIDICQDGRADVIAYVREKYGHVAQIITFGRLKAKAAVKDVARVMGLSPADGQRLANLVPSELNITIDEALERSSDLKREIEQDPQVRRVFDTARALEHHARHAGVHAAGVVIATQPLENIVPLCKTSGTDDVVTQWDGPTCEKVGLLKMDFLGLRTLSTIERARQLIRDTLPDEAVWRAVGRVAGSGPHPLDLDRLTYDEQRVFELFRRGDTAGVFQFESAGMRKLLVEMRPDRIEDLIAANALYRPGPMDLIPAYNARKHGREPVPAVHPIVDEFTRETYGIMVYQEQVMQIVHGLGDIPLRAAYSLIKAISKKKQQEIDKVRPTFIQGAMLKGLSDRQANELFDLILKFAGYGFNKSHSTGYAIIAYETAYLKTYFPNQYMAALLTYESQARKVDDWAPYLEDCKRTCFPDHSRDKPHVGVQVRPPDLNLSQQDFSVVFDPDEPRDALHGHVRFGLGAIRGAGSSAVRSIIEERDANGPFESVFDLCERVDLKSVNRAMIEALIKCGTLDSIHERDRRSALVASIEDAMRAGQSAAEDRRAGQMNFFDSLASVASTAGPLERALPDVPPWEVMETLRFEKEVLGFHVSGHPLDQHERELRALSTHEVADLATASSDSGVALGGLITRVRRLAVRNGPNAGRMMAWITVQDKTGSVECVLFSDAYERNAPLLEADRIVFVCARIDSRVRSEEQTSLIVDRVIPVEEGPRELSVAIEVDVPETDSDGGDPPYEHLKEVLFDASRVGSDRAVEVYLNVLTGGKRVMLRPSMLRVTIDRPLLERLGELVGPDHVRLRGGVPATSAPNGNGYGNGRRGNGRRS